MARLVELRPSQRYIYGDEHEQDERGIPCAYFEPVPQANIFFVFLLKETGGRCALLLECNRS
jgi:hypothetical protein